MDLPFLAMTLPELIRSVGYVGVFLMVFIESGIPIGLVLPLPGDTLLFSAGMLAATSVFDLVPLLVLVIIAAALGDSAGYWFGARFGTKLFSKENAMFLTRRNLARTEAFYHKHGGKAIILARFLPVFRTMIPLFAGVARMNYRSFLIYNLSGALIWGVSVTLLGYYLGSMIPDIDRYLLPILLVIILASVLPIVREAWKARQTKNAAP